jgi:DnaJ homologue, subfamily C, member 28, conserved domain
MPPPRLPLLLHSPCTLIRQHITYTPRVYSTPSSAFPQRAPSRETEPNRHDEPTPNAADSSPTASHDPGAMTRRLESLAETARGIPHHFHSPVPSEPSPALSEPEMLKLQDRIAQADFHSKFATQLAQHTLPTSADKLTRQIAADDPWQGEESLHDGALRMLTDVHKPIKLPVGRLSALGELPLRGPSRLAGKTGVTGRVLAAKEASQGYSLLKEKFSAPGVRGMPGTTEGLASLAEERIVNARSRGEFKNLPGRGKPLHKDHLDNSPYLDRTGTPPPLSKVDK